MVSLMRPPKKQAGEKPAEILFVVGHREVDAQLFAIKPGLFALREVGHRDFSRRAA
jgi:hypothetical protein